MSETEWLTLAEAYALLGEIEPKAFGLAMAQGDIAYQARRWSVRSFFYEWEHRFRRSDFDAWKLAYDAASVKRHS
jgi:hypothetical protein